MKHFKTKGFRAVVALAVVFSLVVGFGGNGAIFTYAAEFVYAKGTGEYRKGYHTLLPISFVT